MSKYQQKKKKQARKLPGLFRVSVIFPANDLAAHAHFIVAGTAIHRAIILGQEWNLCLGTTLGANHTVHLARGTLTTANTSTPLGATCCTAVRAASRLVHQALLLVELLLS